MTTLNDHAHHDHLPPAVPPAVADAYHALLAQDWPEPAADAPVILDLCGGTGSWALPFREAGYRVVTIDPLVDGGDVRLHRFDPDLVGKVEGILASPPCTHLCGSGARWWKAKGEAALLESMSIVDACLRLVALYQPRWWAIENPVGRLSHHLGRPALVFDPCDFGDPWTKRTCLWGSFTAPAKDPVEPVRPEGTGTSWLCRLSGQGPATKALRSMTAPGFARAFFNANSRKD